MLFLKQALAAVIASLILLTLSMPLLADLNMKPRTCSNCSGFGSQSSNIPHRPSSGITGHQSFDHQPFKPYRPQTYDSFKHSGKQKYHHDKPEYRDYRQPYNGYQHHYQPHHNGISLGIVAPIIYSGTYYSNTAPSTYSPATVTPSQLRPSRNLVGQNIDAWAALGNYQTVQALNGFAYQSEQNPQNSLPKVGYALATALAGEYDKAAWAMDLALAANITALHYFQIDANMQLVLEEMLLNYPNKPLMSATILYLLQDYQAAGITLSKAMANCQDCRSEQNLQTLIQRKQG